MKTMRLMAATALAVGTVTGALVESAEGQVVFGGHSRRSGNNDSLQFVDETLLLVTEDSNNRLIQDSDDSSSIGFFEGAIRDFNFYGSTIDAGSPFASIDFDPSTRRPVEFTEDDIEFSIDFANLKAEQLDSSEISSVSGQTLIRYTFSTNQSVPDEFEFPPQEAFLFTDLETLTNISSVLRQRGAENILFDENTAFSLDDATNSIEAIFFNNLLGLTVDEDTASSILGGSSLDSLLNDEQLRSFFVLDETFTVPEPGTTTTLLALGALGVALGLKRKLK